MLIKKKKKNEINKEVCRMKTVKRKNKIEKKSFSLLQQFTFDRSSEKITRHLGAIFIIFSLSLFFCIKSAKIKIKEFTSKVISLWSFSFQKFCVCINEQLIVVNCILWCAENFLKNNLYLFDKKKRLKESRSWQ